MPAINVLHCKLIYNFDTNGAPDHWYVLYLQVNGESLIGVTHRQAADILLQSGERVCLHVHHPYNEEWLTVEGDRLHDMGQNRSRLFVGREGSS